MLGRDDQDQLIFYEVLELYVAICLDTADKPQIQAFSKQARQDFRGIANLHAHLHIGETVSKCKSS